jgi:hypothetical protein
MTAPLTRRRKEKEDIIREIIETSLRILVMPKSSLDMIDMRKLKETSKNLTQYEKIAKPM